MHIELRWLEHMPCNPMKDGSALQSLSVRQYQNQFLAIMVLTVNLSTAERRGMIRQSVSRKVGDASGVAAYRHELDISEPLLERIILTLNHSKKGLL
jgi:hypothetical protein